MANVKTEDQKSCSEAVRGKSLYHHASQLISTPEMFGILLPGASTTSRSPWPLQSLPSQKDYSAGHCLEPGSGILTAAPSSNTAPLVFRSWATWTPGSSASHRTACGDHHLLSFGYPVAWRRNTVGNGQSQVVAGLSPSYPQ